MYIRTENGIYEDLTVGYCSMVHFCSNGIRVSEEDIIKQSDNINELCDEFVLYDNQFNTYGVFDKKVITFKWLKEHFGLYDKGMTIYGAIWTSKGLIFVTKMNENGELVLI